MARITPLPRSKWSPYTRIVDLVATKMFGQSLEPLGIFARVPALVRASAGVERAFISRRRQTPHRILELVALRTATEVGCPFCIDLGSHVLHTKHGVTVEQLGRLGDHRAPGLFTAAEVVALDLAIAVTATPPTADDALFARAKEHFSEDQLVEIVAMIGWENYRARTNEAFGLGAQGFTAGGACALPAHPHVQADASSERAAAPSAA